jgi:hypothetical protein
MKYDPNDDITTPTNGTGNDNEEVDNIVENPEKGSEGV